MVGSGPPAVPGTGGPPTGHPGTRRSKIGVLALQGAFREHIRMLTSLGADAGEVRTPGELDGLDGLVIPGGESTTIGLLMEKGGLLTPLREFVEADRGEVEADHRALRSAMPVAPVGLATGRCGTDHRTSTTVVSLTRSTFCTVTP